jgi:ribonucleoside-triphosphate reductase
MVNFIGTLQNEWAGAQAFNSIDTYLAPFIRKDKLSYREIKQAIQKFVFNVNIASRWGGQSPFVNLTFDWTVPRDLAHKPIVWGGKLLEETYDDYQKEMDSINKAFIEVLIEGDMNGRPFTFPIPTYNLTRDFDWKNGNAKLLFDMTAKYGLPYFSNFINSDLNPSDVRSMCCRLRLNLRQLDRNVTGGLFGSGDSTGSVGVVSINMPRIAYLSKNKSEFLERLEYLMGLAKSSLETKREIVEKNMQGGLLPYTKRYLGTLKNHFSTIGPIGMNEACLNLLGEDIASPEGRSLAIETLEFMKTKLSDFQEETSHIYNLEAVPAEGTSYRLARIDKRKYPDIITAGKGVPYYTNSTLLPVNRTEDVIEALEHQEELQTLYTGGTVFHIFLGERMSSGEAAKRLLKKIAYNSRIPYITITPTYSICPDHGYLIGEHSKCPTCGKVCDVYSRVVGYFRPVRNWNEGKQEEFKQRLEYKEKIALEKDFSEKRECIGTSV